MKKTPKEQEQKGKPRRLTLNRETIQALDDSSLHELVKGGLVHSSNSFGTGGSC